jgi:hypothetical protein
MLPVLMKPMGPTGPLVLSTPKLPLVTEEEKELVLFVLRKPTEDATQEPEIRLLSVTLTDVGLEPETASVVAVQPGNNSGCLLVSTPPSV